MIKGKISLGRILANTSFVASLVVVTIPELQSEYVLVLVLSHYKVMRFQLSTSILVLLFTLIHQFSCILQIFKNSFTVNYRDQNAVRVFAFRPY